MGYSTVRNGLVDMQGTMSALVQDMLDGGFKMIWADKMYETTILRPETVKVYLDGEEVTKDKYTLGNPSNIYPEALARVEFLPEFIPSVGSKYLNIDFKYNQNFLDRK